MYTTIAVWHAGSLFDTSLSEAKLCIVTTVFGPCICRTRLSLFSCCLVLWYETLMIAANPARGLGERCNLPHGSGRSPTAKRYLVHFAFGESNFKGTFTKKISLSIVWLQATTQHPWGLAHVEWGPLFVGPLFGTTCFTCLNPSFTSSPFDVVSRFLACILICYSASILICLRLHL